jgi:hypothetical protein
MRNSILILTFIGISSLAVAQRVDTTKKTVVVTSAFKPTLKPAAKINFSAATPVTDSTRLNLAYNVPSQNLFFTYQPVSLKPLAVSIDTTIDWGNSNYIKLGYGNFSTPFAQAGFSFGNGEGSVINVHTKHISSKGKLPFQQYSRSNAEAIGIFNTAGNAEWRGNVGFDNNVQHKYGYQPETLVFTKEQLLQRFTTFKTGVGVRNKQNSEYGISYNPNLSLNLFGDSHNGREVNAYLNAPLSKSFGEDFAFNLCFTADVTNFKRGDGTKINNNLFYITPSLSVKKPQVSLTAGFTPSWDNTTFKLLPNFTGQLKLGEEGFVLQAGFIGYYDKNNYQSLAAFNPWINQPDQLLNTRVNEAYGGIKGSLGSHFTFNTRLSTFNFNNKPLFVNDSADGKSFNVIYEPKMRALRIHGEIGYTVQEKFSLVGAVNLTNYSGMTINERAWGLLPLELTGAMRWQVLKDLHFKTDIFFWDGPQYRTKTGGRDKLKPAVDLNTGVEFTVMPKLNLWVQFNNVLNNRYQRWNQYEVLGFNVLGGIVYSFSQTAK